MTKIKYYYKIDKEKFEERTATLLGIGPFTRVGGQTNSVFWVFDKAGHLIRLEASDIIQVTSE